MTRPALIKGLCFYKNGYQYEIVRTKKIMKQVMGNGNEILRCNADCLNMMTNQIERIHDINFNKLFKKV
jgi:hypothetical protein